MVILLMGYTFSSMNPVKSAPLTQDELQIQLTSEEQAWLEEHPVITLSVDDGNPL
jgi:hypothetical protein